MARLAPIITKEELALKLDKYLNVSDEDEDRGMETFPYSLPEKVMKDISKVEFDFENYEYKEYGFSKYPVGYVTLPSGIPVLFVNAGGDWEFPVCFALYWDGTQVRGYFPTKGQAFNAKAKSAFGNGNEGDLEDEEAEALVNEDEIIADANNRIKVRA